jgi:hypothetical protein
MAVLAELRATPPLIAAEAAGEPGEVGQGTALQEAREALTLAAEVEVAALALLVVPGCLALEAQEAQEVQVQQLLAHLPLH